MLGFHTFCSSCPEGSSPRFCYFLSLSSQISLNVPSQRPSLVIPYKILPRDSPTPHPVLGLYPLHPPGTLYFLYLFSSCNYGLLPDIVFRCLSVPDVQTYRQHQHWHIRSSWLLPLLHSRDCSISTDWLRAHSQKIFVVQMLKSSVCGEIMVIYFNRMCIITGNVKVWPPSPNSGTDPLASLRGLLCWSRLGAKDCR